MSTEFFTEQDIITALNTERPEWPRSLPKPALPVSNANYIAIVNYLTGREVVLQPLVNDYDHIHSWPYLINLLHNLGNFTARELLVINVIKSPAFDFVQYAFKAWIKDYVFQNPTESIFQAALNEFRQMNMTDDDIFEQFVFGSYSAYALPKHNKDAGQLADTPVETFLIGQIKSWTVLRPTSKIYNSWHNRWIYPFFFLLEKANPQFAKEYLKIGFDEHRQFNAFFVGYKNGVHLPSIIEFIEDEQDINLKTMQVRFSSAIELYESDNTAFSELVTRMAYRYLEAARKPKLERFWEGSYNKLNDFKGESSNLATSACAFHFILKDDLNKGLDKLNEWVANQKPIDISVIKVLKHHIQSGCIPYIVYAFTLAVDIHYYKQFVDYLQTNFDPAQYLPVLWQQVSHKSKPLRLLVAATLADNDPAAEQKAIALLAHKNGDARQTAAVILGYFSTEMAKDAILKVLNTESNDATRDDLLQSIAGSLPTEVSMNFIEDMVAAAKKRNKLNKPVEAWLAETDLPALYFTNGHQLSVDDTRFLLYRMSRTKDMRSDLEARYITRFLDKTTAGAFAMALIKHFLDKGARPDLKYLLATAALVGDDAVVDKVRATINKWIEESRSKMAEYGVGALALQGGDKALRWVEWYSRKYKSKKSNVGAAALDALETAADELNISIHELGDRVVPDFGFDGLFKTFEAGGESYRAFIDSNFKMAFFDDDNKKLKAVPAATDAALKDEFKNIAKEVRDIVKSQSSRLEYYLIIQRKWRFDKWEEFFLQNPVMFIYATKLLWGRFDETGVLQDTFMCNDDTSCINVEGDEITIDRADTIGIVHPTQLAADNLQKWRQQFFDAAVTPVFPQLDRKPASMDNIDLSKTISHSFEDKQMQVGSTRSTLEKFGWHKGPVGDGGMLTSMNLLYFEKRLEAVLEVEGIGAGFGWGMDEKLGRLYVIDKTKVTGRWVYIKDDNDERLVKLKDVPTIFLNEMLAAIQAIKPVDKKVEQ